LRSRGTVGSTNGLGVLSSTNTGMLIATLEPRRRRMLAVRVLWRRRKGEREGRRSGRGERRSAAGPSRHGRRGLDEGKSTHGKRTCWLMISSGRNKLLATPPPGLKYGSVKTPSAPSRGNTVSVRGTSCGFMRDLASCRRKRMLPSTKRRSERVAPYGAPGVDSSM